MKDFIETTCEHCNRIFRQPYPSMQEQPPKAPTFQQMKNTQEKLLQDLIYHQNKQCQT